MTAEYQNPGPTRAEIDALQGPALLEFGTGWCGWCQGAQPLVAQALAANPGIPHIKVEDGSGRKLGRSFAVKLWPTLIVLSDGREVDRFVRPSDAAGLREALASAAKPQAR